MTGRSMTLIKRFFHAFFWKELDFRVRVFNSLAFAGIGISLATGIWGLILGLGMLNILSCGASCLVAAVLLLYSNKTGRYERCYLITIAAVFMVLFPLMFFSSGGYKGGMPAWFVFAAVFTVFMLDGKKVFFVGAAELAILANMSHEIRNPINVILGMNEMVLRESEDKTITAYGRKIEDAGKSLMALINNILDAARIDAGKEERAEEKYRTADLARELYVLGSGEAAKKGLRFTVETGEDLPSELYGDFTRIKQIGANFLSNAVKYTGRGTITVFLDGEKNNASGGDQFLLRIAVQDTEMGIKQDDIPLLFSAFTRLDQGRRIEGSGLGLSIVKETAALLGGEINVKSEPGVGSIFTAIMPQKILDNSPMGIWKAGTEREQASSFTAPEGRVLVVDDSAENRLVIKDLLRRTLLHIDTAESGAECLEMVQAQQYHAIIMDYMMPDME